MESDKKTGARIGMVKYLNTAPIHEQWKATVDRPEWQMIEAPPATLNKMLLDGEIDLGFVSSFEYGAHPEQYKILPGLSISANGPVGSVFLFSHAPFTQLDGADILLSAQSDTSVQLVKIILEEFHGVKPKYQRGEIMAAGEREFPAVLAIGDEALRLVEQSTYLYQFDLGDIWKRQTGLPFVFSVCAVQRSFCDREPELLAEIHGELLRCRNEGKEKLQEICKIAAPRIPLTEKQCFDYLTAIEYDFSASKRKALETFFQILIKRGMISEKALPLEIFTKDL